MAFSNSINLELFEKGPTVLFIWKNESGWPVESVSPNLFDIFGYLPERYVRGELHYADQIHPDDLQRVVAEVQKASADSRCDSVDHQPYRYLDAQGKYRWVKDSTRIVRSKIGAITHYIGYLVDMTTEVEFKEESIRLKERLELAWSATNDGLWDWEIASGYAYFSDRWKAMIGYAPEEFPNDAKAFFDAIHPEDQPIVHSLLQRHFADPDHVPYEIDIRMRTKEGNYKWIRTRGKTTLNPDGTPHRMAGAHTDISDYKESQLELEESEKRWRIAVDGSGDGLWDWDVLNSEVYFSERWKKMLGFEPDEIGNSLDEWVKRVHPDDLDEVYADVQNCMSGETPIYRNKHRVLCKDGTYKWILDRGVIIEWTENHEPKRMVGTHTDIDESEKNHRRITLLQRRYASMFHDHSSIMLLIDPQSGNIIDINKSAESFYGYSRQEFLSLSTRDLNLLSPEEIDQHRQEAIEKKENHFIFPHRLKNGEVRTVEVFSSPIETENGYLLYSIIRDVTEAKANEEKLKVLREQTEADKQRYEALMKYASDGIFIMDFDGNLHECNHIAAKMLGYTVEEMTSLSVYDWDAHIPQDQLPHLIRGISSTESIRFETIHRRKNGTLYNAAITAIKIIVDDQELLYASARDITEQKVTERNILDLNQKLTNLAQNVPGVVYTYQYFPDGRSCFPYASEHIYGIYGVTPDEVREDGSKVFSLLHPDDTPHILNSITTSFEQLTLWEDEYRVLHPEKGVIWVKGSAKPVLQEDGSVLWL